METLIPDLKKIVWGSADLVSRSSSLVSPSWRFPEKLAVALDVERALEERDEHTRGHDFVLELVIDRLLLVLQCCVQELESANGSRSSNPPLTLGSTVKRLSKCILQNASRSSRMKEQISIKNQQVGALNSSLHELQQKHELLRSAVAGTPYDRTQAENHEQTALPASTPAMAEAPGHANACVQTTDTAFALCAQCVDTQLALVESARLVCGLCSRSKLNSKFASYDWDSLMKIGRLDVANWYEALQSDAAALDELNYVLLEKINGLSSERDSLEESCHGFKNRIQALETQLDSLKDLHTHSSMALGKSKKEFATSTARLEDTQSQLKSRNTKMKKELVASEQRVIELGAVVAELKESQGQLEAKLRAMESHEQELQRSKRDIEVQLESVMRQSQEALNDRQVELNKSKLHNQTLEKRYQAMKNKQTALLTQLDALDEECTALKDELRQVESSREKLACDLQQVQAHYEHVQQQLNTERNKLSESNQKQEELSIQLTSLHTQLSNAKQEVETEKENCRLLMDYPFVKQSSETYSDHLSSLSESHESRKQITANTIRILLLEEQNNELRHTSVKEARELKERHLDSDFAKVIQPVQLWEQELVGAIEDQQLFIRSSAKKRTIYTEHKESLQRHQSTNSQGSALKTRSAKTNTAPLKEDSYTEPLRLTSSGVKGRHGHLRRAIADAHRKTSSAGKPGSWDVGQKAVDIEVYSCDKCDRMFCDIDEMQEHISSCKD